MDFCLFTATEVATCIMAMESSTAVRGDAQFGSVVANKIYVLKYLTNNCIMCGKLPTLAGFDAQAFVNSIDEYLLSK